MRNTCLNMVHTLAKHDPRVVFVGSDLGAGTLDDMRQEMPERFFMEGISEQALIGLAAGLAMDGYIPFVNTIATFITRRSLEQVAIDLCLHKLPVRLIGNGGGLVYAPLGPTHMAIEDMGLMMRLPNMTVVAPSDAQEMIRFMWATLDYPGPVYVRLGKGGDPVLQHDDPGFAIGRGQLLRNGTDALLVSTGVMSHRCLQAADLLAEQGYAVAVLHLPTVKPLDHDLIQELAETVPAVICVEEHVRNGGLGSAILDMLADRLPTNMPAMLRLGLPDQFTEHYGSQDALLAHYQLQPDAIAQSAQRFLLQLEQSNEPDTPVFAQA